MTQEYLRSILEYSSEAGEFRWKWRDSQVPTINARCAGKVAGSENGQGYIKIVIDGRGYRAHRLAWLYMTGDWPKDQIDHINRDRADNRFCNLRDVSAKENVNNSRPRAKKVLYLSESGDEGVYWHNQTKKWVVCVGGFDTQEKARAYREKIVG